MPPRGTYNQISPPKGTGHIIPEFRGTLPFKGGDEVQCLPTWRRTHPSTRRPKGMGAHSSLNFGAQNLQILGAHILNWGREGEGTKSPKH